MCQFFRVRIKQRIQEKGESYSPLSHNPFPVGVQAAKILQVIPVRRVGDIREVSFELNTRHKPRLLRHAGETDPDIWKQEISSGVSAKGFVIDLHSLPLCTERKIEVEAVKGKPTELAARQTDRA